ncbi:MAG TPA: metallophosphoesterase [Verrucomicrobiae bacterium]|jgi:3',5'-cyclic AMP phosphodiesterase CpdA|nr:metallophosphoesterase [Verrucomicrobiae bacterium]
MKQLRVFLIGLICCPALLLFGANPDSVIIAQLSDTHLGEEHSPQAAANLRQAVKMINARHPNAVILSGDIGENQERREQVKTILKALDAPVYYVPGNHDVHNVKDLELYRNQFGPDYYRFQVKYVEVLAVDSELLGNYEKYAHWKTLPPLSSGMEAESEKMLDWLGRQTGPIKGNVVIAVQHIPLFYDDGFPKNNAYWIVDPPYSQRETDLLHRLGVKHLLAGHWHTGRVFEHDGFTIHVAPSTSWLPFGGQLGFAVHTITANGDVHTEFVPLPNAMP